MFKCDDLIYIQLQKTGCTHIAALLSQLFQGEHIGKHNAATAEQIRSTPFFLSSIRNPWDWYLSLWTYGVGGKGSLWQRLTHRNIRAAARTYLTSGSPGRVALHRARSVRDEITKDVSAWRSAYDRSDNVHAFRTWLRMIHDPRHALRLSEGYGETVIADRYGFMTHRYFLLCCQNMDELTVPGAVTTYEDLARFDRAHCYIHQFVRQEALEETLFQALQHVRPLTSKDREIIFGAQKTNKSERALQITDYYDQELVDLIAQRDRLIVDKFGYSPPTLRRS